ncbi:MAG: hypothetical protein K0R52_384 [Alphaproteobacteria bacterium]|jgi:hypothetical protein|nr:hypothetical protein [Alphaproteobacteria bacterium]
MKMKLLNFASLAVMATLGSLSSVSSACAGEETAALRQEPQPLGRRSECPPLGRFPLTLLSHAATFLNEKDLVNFLSTCRHVKECEKDAREQRDINLDSRLLSLPDDLSPELLQQFDHVDALEAYRYSHSHFEKSYFLFKRLELFQKLNNLDVFNKLGNFYGCDLVVELSNLLERSDYLERAGVNINEDDVGNALCNLYDSGRVTKLSNFLKGELKALHERNQLDGPDLAKEFVILFKKLDTVKKLTLTVQVIDDGIYKFWTQICGLNKLQKLILHRGSGDLRSFSLDKLTDDHLKSLSLLLNLQELDLVDIRSITDVGLAYVSKIHSLQKLSLDCLPLITGVGIRHLSCLVNLKQLTLTHLRFEDDALAHVSMMNKLQSLTLGKLSAVTNAGLVHLGRMQHLKQLTLEEGIPFEHDALAPISNMDNLQNLILKGIGDYCHQDDALAHVSRIGNFQNLTLENLYFTETGLAPLSHMHHLNQLTFIGFPAYMISADIRGMSNVVITEGD